MSLSITRVQVLRGEDGRRRGHAFVRVETDGGVVGLGESGAWGYPDAAASVLAELAPYLIGVDPYRTEYLWHFLNRVRPFRGNIVGAAVAAVNNALWDIKGKALDVPVWQLAGGRSRDRVRLHALLRGSSVAAIAGAAAQAAADGFTAVKVDPLLPGYRDHTARRLVESVRAAGAAAREAVGDDVDLIFELHRKLQPDRALAVSAVLAEFDPLFIEDPVQIDSVAEQARVPSRVQAPMAIGERLTSLWEFQELLSRHSPIHVRPDVGLSGGLSHCLKIAALAEAYNCGVAPHNAIGAALTPATLHFCVVIPNLVTMEYDPALEEPANDDGQLVQTTLRRDGAWLQVPTDPGFGVALREDRVRVVFETSGPPAAHGKHQAADGFVTKAV
ncbi:MAG TPA: mandelate racemase/muconate lactonizing enzyme family protein [Micromonosporaceae bacterium]